MIEKIFYGRNGIDTFSLFLLLLAIPFSYFKYTLIIGFLLIAYAIFRCFSKNIVRRRAEEWKFKSILFSIKNFFSRHTKGIRGWFKFLSLKWKNRKTTVYFRCPKCKKILSLPKHKGKLAVTCTVCGNEFLRKT